MKLAILSNVNVAPIATIFKNRWDVFEVEGYGEWIGELINDHSNLNKFIPDALFLLLDGEELLKNLHTIHEKEVYLEKCIRYIEMSKQKLPNTLIFISTIDLPQKEIKSIKDKRYERQLEYKWYKALTRLSDNYEGLYIFDLKKLVEEVGRQYFYSNKMWYLGGVKFSLDAERIIGKEITRFMRGVSGERKKCLILDLDNTLWGGVIGEDGIENIKLASSKEGAQYYDLQKRVKEIKDTGIILGIVSKNNFEDPLEVFLHHPHSVLSKDDFAEMRINWELKSVNIKSISEELNIGLDSIVFVDDNEFEREEVKNCIKEVCVPDFPYDTSQLENFITDIYEDHFLSLSLTEEDRKKTEVYQQNTQRKQLAKKADCFEDYLTSLEMSIKVWEAQKEDIKRIVQLVHKTNQFNLTTKRYTQSQIMDIMNDDLWEIYVCNVRDRFGDHGTVAIMVVSKEDTKIPRLDLFLMSCRVMGRYIEDNIMDFLEKRLSAQGYEQLEARYVATHKNKPVENLFERLGYNIADKNGLDKLYRKSIYSSVSQPKNIYSTLTFEDINEKR